MKELHSYGYNGVVLEYAVEVLEDENNAARTTRDELEAVCAKGTFLKD